VLASKWGIAQGFDTYSEKFDLSKYTSLSLGSVQKRGDEVMGDAVRWLGQERRKPFFAWIHLYDPHTPYDPPEPFASRYPGRPYVGEVAYTDSLVGQLLDFLRERGLEENTIVVVTADHGESLGDHEEQTHAFFVYESSMRVPLIIKTPWGDRGRIAANVSTADIAPTLLDLAGLEPLPSTDGVSRVLNVLAPRAQVAERPSYLETYFPRYHFGWQHLRAIRLGEWKYIEAPEPELYRIAGADFRERTNEFKANSRRADELRKTLETLAGDGKNAAPERANLDPETLERLAALGYVGSTAPIAPDAVLADPKSKIALFNRMSLAKAQAQKDETLALGIETMNAVLTEDPGIIDAHLTLANWLNRAKRANEAIARYREVLKLQPENVIAMNNLAQVYRARREWNSAIEGYRAVLKLDPKSPQAWYQLATLYLDTGQIAEAEKTFREALRANPKMGASYVSLGVIAFSRGDRAAAESLVREGLAIESDLRSAHYTLARIVEERSDRAAFDEAARLYERELAGFPDHGRARFNLAQIHRARGDRAAYLRGLESLITESPEFGPGFFFLARERLSEGRIDAAFDLATRGLAVDQASEVSPLGHFVLADVWNRRGDQARSRAEALKGQALTARIRRSPRRSL
jgi:tetratricopeptide (TPR) repeat protein